MRDSKIKKVVFLCVISLFLITSCSDTGTSIDEIAPEIPELSQAQPSFDFFKGKVAAEVSTLAGDNFQYAAVLTQSVEAIMSGLSSLPVSFTASAEGVSATFDDGIWTWEYTSSSAGNSVTIKLTAEVKPLQTDWAMFITVSAGEISFDDYKLFDGFVKNTSNEGQWNFYSYSEQSTTPVITFDWDIESDTDATFSVTFGDASFSRLDYVKALPDNTLTLTSGDSGPTTIYWNSDTGTGYYEISNQGKVCWDENGDNVTCPV